jgi:hypothetical protein
LNPKHKTPLTITAKVWNYCQLACPYCASRSNHWRWYPGLVPKKNELLDFDRLIQWVKCHTPGAVLHVSGGEPLLWDGIENAIEKVIRADIPATMTTNGLLIAKRPRLLEMPLKWIVTHHKGVNFERWHANAALIREKPHIVCRIINREKDMNADTAAQYDGFNFCFAPINGLRVMPWEPRALDLNCIASNTLHLIEPDGRVFACNNAKAGQVGHIYTMEYDRGLARGRDAQTRQCSKVCPAYQSAVLTDNL